MSWAIGRMGEAESAVCRGIDAWRSSGDPAVLGWR